MSLANSKTNQTLIIVITPTYSRLTQLADMTRMANTLMHVPNLHWIVIEDGLQIDKNIRNLLRRSQISFSYLPFKTQPGYPKRGWFQRSMALTLLRETARHFKSNTNSVVYFGDDDNSYDIRLFTEYIRNVRKLGMWSVGGWLLKSGRAEAARNFPRDATRKLAV
ncbi:unnamed protein product [Caenorhabditis angaria]|uniref:Galactosylgalactosylxylosylprotein 3-beta-glucuronosyltransferase n=1 Tax=Caenorhabditis angaria TaxID=860376 RepID=A0A9P1N421_9PELO|nr:unnamed protein product [Caenorhabditis angaria]